MNRAPSAQTSIGSLASPASCLLLASGVARLRRRPATLRTEKSLTHQGLSSALALSDVGMQRKTFCVDAGTGSPRACRRPGGLNDPFRGGSEGSEVGHTFPPGGVEPGEIRADASSLGRVLPGLIRLI